MAQKTWTGAVSGDWSAAGNWESTAVPIAGDDVRIPAGSPDIDAGLNQSAVALGDVIVEEGYTGTIGYSTNNVHTYLQIDPDRFEFAGTGEARIDLGAAAIAALVKNAGSGGTGTHGLYLKGTALTSLSVGGGDVGIASVHGSTSTVTKVDVVNDSASLTIGEGCLFTTAAVHAGTATIRSGSTLATLNVYGGDVAVEEVSPLLNVNVYAGDLDLNTTGTVTNLNCHGGDTSMLQSGSTRVVTTATIYPGAAFSYDKNTVNVGTLAVDSRPIRIDTSAP